MPTPVAGKFPRLLRRSADEPSASTALRDRFVTLSQSRPCGDRRGVSAEAEKSLVEPYKEGLVARWGIKKFNLDDLYVRFFGLAERRIAGMTGKGVVSFISNFSYLGDRSFLVMRQRLLSEFDTLWLIVLEKQWP